VILEYSDKYRDVRPRERKLVVDEVYKLILKDGNTRFLKQKKGTAGHGDFWEELNARSIRDKIVKAFSNSSRKSDRAKRYPGKCQVPDKFQKQKPVAANGDMSSSKDETGSDFGGGRHNCVGDKAVDLDILPSKDQTGINFGGDRRDCFRDDDMNNNNNNSVSIGSQDGNEDEDKTNGTDGNNDTVDTADNENDAMDASTGISGILFFRI
jgi:hypothetical protein